MKTLKSFKLKSNWYLQMENYFYILFNLSYAKYLFLA
jgi:hypothetical protein